MSVKTYSHNSTVRLSDNFAASEFRCKCGKQHDTLISSELVEKLQSLIGTLGASKAMITSGYRCPAHDKAVGGTGYGQHTKGLAADVIFYDRSGSPIITKLISCKAQDAGFSGIANIDSTYTAIHLDVRTSGKWYGDEVRGTSSSVTTDFYAYYGISRSASYVRQLQMILNSKGSSLSVDGIAGTKTLSEVRKYIIDRGDSGELTKWLQERLNALGCDCGAPDGIAGEKTMVAVHKWQSENNLGVGYFGGGDWDVLLK